MNSKKSTSCSRHVEGGNHMYTWSFAYNIDAIREWLFAQKKA